MEDNLYPLFLYEYGTDGLHGGAIPIHSEAQLKGIGVKLILQLAKAEKREVIITDADDFTVFHMKDGKILFPTENPQK